MRSSQYIRPKMPPAIEIQRRDVEICKALFDHRYLTTEHVRSLLFPGRRANSAGRRLRALWANGFLDRRFLHLPLTGCDGEPRRVRSLHCLARRGAELVARFYPLDLDQIPHTPAQNAEGFATIEHHLVATDFFVALEATLRTVTGTRLVSVQREHQLRPIASRAHPPSHGRGSLVSDGAVTLENDREEQYAFHLEVVRSAARGGNKTLLAKMKRYAQLAKQGYFRQVFGHQRVRGVLFATTSQERADNLRAHAQTLRSGRSLFWFGAYPRAKTRSLPITTFTPGNILDPLWTVAGEQTPRSLVSPDGL